MVAYTGRCLFVHHPLRARLLEEKTSSNKPYLIAGAIFTVVSGLGAYKLFEINFPGSVSTSVIDQSVISVDVNTGEHATLSPESRRMLEDTNREQEAVKDWLEGQKDR